MKTSTYIIIIFLTFVFGTAMVLPIDSKLHEQEYITQQNYLADVKKLLHSDYSGNLDEFSDGILKLNEMSDQNLSNVIYKLGNAIEVFDRSIKNHRDVNSLQFIKRMCELQLKQNKLSIMQRYIYGNVLLDLGLTDDAIKQLEIVGSIESGKSKNYFGKGGIINENSTWTYVFVEDARKQLKELKSEH